MRDVRRFLDGLEAGPGPQLVFLHAVLPHWPWELLPSTQRYNHPWITPGWDGGGDNRWGDDRRDLRAAHERLLLQTRATDKLLGEVVARLRQLGLYDRSLVMVTADHGLTFEPGALRRADDDPRLLARDVLPVPLFVKFPGQDRGKVDGRLAETIDLAPTLADVFGFEPPWQMDGMSLVGDRRRLPEDTALAKVFGVSDRFLLGNPRALRSEAVAWNTALAADPRRFLPHAELLDRPVSSLQVERDSGFGLELRDPALYFDVDPEAAFVPAHICGRVVEIHSDRDAFGLERPLLAVAVNGTVRALALGERPRDGGSEFSATVPGSSFRRGANRIEVLVARQAPGAWRLFGTSPMDASELASADWDHSAVLLVRGGGAGFAGVEAGDQVQLSAVGRGAQEALEVRALGADPMVFLPVDLAGRSRLLVAVEVTTPRITDAYFFWQTSAAPFFHWRRSTRQALAAGRSRLVFEIEDVDLDGRLRFDPGTGDGTYLLHRIEVREPRESHGEGAGSAPGTEDGDP
ncbi:MAG: sulfatase-like hydrolase/transferase [Acidobacteriota bacterium]